MKINKSEVPTHNTMSTPIGLGLADYKDRTLIRFLELRNELSASRKAPTTRGVYTLSTRIPVEEASLNFQNLLLALSELPSYTGWPVLSVEGGNLKHYDNHIECWSWANGPGDSAHMEFWRISAEGNVTLIREFEEDYPSYKTKRGANICNKFELTAPVWRVGEFIVRIKALVERLCGTPKEIPLLVTWSGLSGRTLTSTYGVRHIGLPVVAVEDTYCSTTTVNTVLLPDSLPAVLNVLLTNLFQLFIGFTPPINFYEEESSRLLDRTF